MELNIVSSVETGDAVKEGSSTEGRRTKGGGEERGSDTENWSMKGGGG